ncbi:hypothetical protein [Cellulomonas edaphi]|uniref:Uncharacterized protein n=1 Tax=Cellulomonas edaphi TaxID=3053468 RepID=A0ABT7S2I6_9CELL|nr:hypothetical protein [Cellulomons edaphi]MDM7829821.1 hypothetical protein [Cellulomons edaphi]
MTTSDDDTPDVAPFPDHVIEDRGELDPVKATAPRAEADEQETAERVLGFEGMPIPPVAGAQAGAVAPPAAPF